MDPEGSYEAVTWLPHEAVSASTARRFVIETLQRWRLPRTARTVELLACELVTNALLHAGSEVELRLRRFEGRLRIEVSDASPAPPRRRDAYATEAVGGRGIVLVEELTDAWGVEPRSSGKVVWCELST